MRTCRVVLVSVANFEPMGWRLSSNSGPVSSDANLKPTGLASGSNSSPADFFRAWDQVGRAYAIAGLSKDKSILKILYMPA